MLRLKLRDHHPVLTTACKDVGKGVLRVGSSLLGAATLLHAGFVPKHRLGAPGESIRLMPSAGEGQAEKGSQRNGNDWQAPVLTLH